MDMISGTIVTGDMKLVRRINRAAVLQLIREKGPISRIALARLSRLTPATANSIVDELVAQGLVKEGGVGSVKGTRKTRLFEFNPSAFAAVGIDLRINRVIASLTDLDAHPLAQVVQTYDGEITGEQGAELVAQATRKVIQDSSVSPDKLIGVGMSLPALIDGQSGTVIKAVNLGWESVPLRNLLEPELGLPIHIIDTSFALTVAETYLGAGRGVQNLICLNLGSGMGSGIVIRGQLYQGVDGVAGEVGHTTVIDDGPQCRCGNYGCLERLVASPAVTERAIRGLKQGAASSIRDLVGANLEDVTLQVVVSAARAGDPFACSIFAETGRYLGIGMANVVNLLNPEMVIVGGGLAQAAGELLLEPLRQTVQLRAFELPARRVRIIPAALGIEASSLGAAVWAMIKVDFLAAQPWALAQVNIGHANR